MFNFSLDFYFYLLIFIFSGAVLGSFSSAILYRIEKGISWIISDTYGAARSQCPYCQHKLKFIDLIPVLSWLLQKGKCRYCQARISKQYLALEVISVILAVAIFLIAGFSDLAFMLLCLMPFALVQIILFYRRHILSKQICAIMIGIFLFYLFIGTIS